MEEEKTEVISLREKVGKRILREKRQKQRKSLNIRIRWIMVIFGIVLFIPLAVTLFRLMVIEHSVHEADALVGQKTQMTVEVSRGTIYDCNKNKLATSTAVENAFLSPKVIHEKEIDVKALAGDLAAILGSNGSSEEEIITACANIKSEYAVIGKKLNKGITDKIRALRDEKNYSGIYFEDDSLRYYPQGKLASQIIGFTNYYNVGSEGLEAYYNDTLTGTEGAIVTTKGNYATEMLYSYSKNYEASEGESLVLTIDSTVQAALESNLAAAIEKYQCAHGGFAVMMNVNTGAIVGMATMDNYDLNQPFEIVDTSVLEHLNDMQRVIKKLEEGTPAYEITEKEISTTRVNALLAQWRNRCVSDGYEPGSTFKVVTLASALEEQAVTLDSTFECAGKETFWGRDQELSCWKAYGHGHQTTAQALQNSCNLAFGHIGLKLGGEKLYSYAKAFGILETTGIDLPGEGSGYFHTLTQLSDYENNGTYSLIDTAFGQSFKVTPIQMVRAIAAVVNGGYVLEPYVVSEVLDGEGNTVRRNERTVIRQAISSETSAVMCQLMESVITEGTAGNAALSGYRIGGKTGTSEKLGEDTEDKIVSFVAVAPIDNPQYVLLVALDSPLNNGAYYVSGGVMAAPLARDILSDTLAYLGVQPDYTNVDMSTVNVQMPDVWGMTEREAKAALKTESLDYVIIGDGSTVTNQIPAAGMPLPGNSVVKLYMGAPLPNDKVPIPDLKGMTADQARAAMANTGLYIQVKGSSSKYATVTSQSLAANAQVPLGTLITVEVTDSSARD